MSTERAHHPYSPSTLGSLEVCPCFQGKQSETPHERTIAGTRAHSVVESGEDDPRLSDEDAIAAAECLDFIDRRRRLMQEARSRAVLDRAVALWGTVVAAPGGEANAEIVAEREVPEVIELKEEYLPIDREDTTAGYCDHVLIAHTGEDAELIDHKFGVWRVEDAATNTQGIAYSLGLFFRFPRLVRIKVFFLQPNAGFVTEAVFTRDQFPTLYLRVKAIVERAKISRQSGSFDAANPTTPNCLFCANIGRCPKLLDLALKVAKKYHPLAFPEDISPHSVMDPKKSATALQLAAVMKVWADGFRQAVTNRVICREAELPAGYKLESRSKREIVDEGKYRAAALKHLTEQEYSGTLKPSLGKVEEIISEKAPRGSKKAAVTEFAKDAEESGAIARSEPFTFLKAVSEKEE